jgi:hypothetical protein
MAAAVLQTPTRNFASLAAYQVREKKREWREGAWHLKEGLGDVVAARGSGGSGGFVREWGEIMCRGRGWT